MIITTRGNYIRDGAIPTGHESTIEEEFQVDEVGCSVLAIYLVEFYSKSIKQMVMS